MRISLFLLFICAFQLVAINTEAQNVRIKIETNHLTISQLISEIEKQSDFLVLFRNQDVDTERIIHVRGKNEHVSTYLETAFGNTDIHYEFQNKYILLSKKGNDIKATLIAQQSGKRITGTVTDEKGEPIIGTTVVEKGANLGTITDVEGKFSLETSGSVDVLVFSFLGYLPKEVKIGDRTYIDIVLQENAQILDEVVVIGYGTQSRRKVISAVSTLSPEKVENIPSSSVINNLGGRTAGIIVTSSGGGPTSKSSISIRGGDRPLVVIDGFITEWFDFENINPKDIENISILKDASAAAIYGARAGNGILMVTTKKGENKEISINYDYSYSMSQPTVMPKKMGSYERRFLMNQAYINDGMEPQFSDEILEKYRTGSDPYLYPNVDWQALCLNRFAPEQKHNLSVSGGNNKNNYYASMSYFDQGTMYVYDTNWYKSYTFRLSVTNTFDKIGLKTTIGVNGIRTQSRMPWSQYSDGYYNTWGHIQNRSPWELAYNDLGLYSNSGDHPLVEMDPRSGYRIPTTTAVNGMFNAEWQVPHVEGLKLKTSGDYRINNYRFKKWRETAPQSTGLGTTELKVQSPPRLEEDRSNSDTYTLNFLVNYDRTILEDISLSSALGYEYSYGKSSYLNASRENYQLNFDQWIAGPTENMRNDGGESEWGRAGYFGRLKLDYKNKYLVEGNFRHDGSDWFPEGKRWGTFYSFSGGWTLTEESFMEKLRTTNILNMLKIRGSYGLVGLDGVVTETYGDGDWRKLKRFAYVPGYSMSGQGHVVDGKYVPVFYEGDLVSPDITWYTQASSNIGFDFTSLNDALYGSFDYFFMRTTGYLASPSGSIYSDPLGKSLPRIKSDGSFRRGGYEFSVGYKNRIGDLFYDVSVNFTHFNELWENNPNEDIATLKNPYKRSTHKTGYLRIGYISDGFYQSYEDIANSPRRQNSVNLSPGDIKYKDLNGDGFIDDSDRTYIGSSAFPRGNYGINLDLRYKGWFMYCLLQGATSRSYYMGDMMRSQWGATFPFQKDYWTPENRDAMYPRLTSNPSFNGNNNYEDSDFWIVNTGYFRLKSLQIGYDFKSLLLKSIPFISTAKLTLSGTNLLTFSKAMDYYFDPESGGDAGNYNNYAYPVQRVYSLTASIGF